MNSLAIEGGGSYGFIPDSTLVGTIFVNALSNFLTTAMSNPTLSLEPENGATFEEDQPVMGGHICHKATWGIMVEFGPINFG